MSPACSDDECDREATAEARKVETLTTDSWQPFCDQCATQLHEWGWEARSL